MKLKPLLLLLTLVWALPSGAAQQLPPAVMQQLQPALVQGGELFYIDFWASWCNPCRKSFPWMNAMQEKYRAKGFQVVAINLDSEKELAETFLSRVPANFSILYDPKGELAEAFALKGMPSSYLINRQGQILAAHKGFFERQQAAYEQELQTLLASIEVTQ